MEIMFYIGVALTILVSIFRSNVMRVELNKVASFLALLVIVTCARIAAYDFMVDIDPNYMPKIPPELYYAPVWHFMLVFWEDAFFVLPMILAFKYLKKSIAILVAITLSLIFAHGHLYQGYIAVAITSLYPYFISYKYSKKFGMGTVMVCHILYDFITFYTQLFMPWLI